MGNASGANRLSQHRLRVLPGGARLAVEKIEVRLAEKRTALALLRAGVIVLIVSLAILIVLVVTSAYYPFERGPQLAVLLLSGCAGLVALGISLVGRGLHHFQRLERRIYTVTPQTGPPPDGPGVPWYTDSPGA
jgi:uncharacterized membrane protein YidH (DUF202 family)